MNTPPNLSYGGADYQTGDTICGRWRVRSICGGRGRSGMGVVYVVDDRLRGEVLAVKTLQPQFVANQRVRDLLRREANAWLGMGRHRNIVALNFVEALGTQIYLFMDYISPDEQGRNCLTHFLVGHPLASQLVAQWSIETCRALAFMREHGVEVHRDIKPDNLMIDGERRVRVTDFGLARAFSGVTQWNVGETLPNVTAIGGIVGTPGYIAPEVVAGDPPSVASDVYAFGLLLIQMLTGKTWAPFAGEWRGDIEEFERATLRIREALHEPISGTPFDAIAARCLEYDPEKRWRDFREIAAALVTACAGNGIQVEAVEQAVQPVGTRPSADHVTALYNLGRLREALEVVGSLRKSDPSDAHLLTCEGVIRGDLGDLTGAIPLLEKACARASGSCSNWNNLGRALRQAKRSSEALVAFQRALDCDDTHANIWASKGNSLFDLQRYEEALAAYDQAITRDRYHWASQLGRAQALEKLERFVDALVALESVLDVEPENVEALALYSSCMTRLRATGEGPTNSDAFALAQRGEHTEALRTARHARLRRGATAELWNTEGALLSLVGDERAALRCLERAQRLEPESWGVWLNKGRVYRALRQPQEALRCFDRAASLAPDDPVAWVGQYECYTDLDLGEQALASLRKACANTHSPEQRAMCRAAGGDFYYLVMADMAYGAKDYAEAYRCAASVASDSPRYAQAVPILVRCRYYLTIRFAKEDLAGEATGFAAAARLLEQAAEEMPTEDERVLMREELEGMLQHYINVAEERLKVMTDPTPLRNLTLLVAKHCRAEWARTWSRFRLCESLMREAAGLIKEADEVWAMVPDHRKPLP